MPYLSVSYVFLICSIFILYHNHKSELTCVLDTNMIYHPSQGGLDLMISNNLPNIEMGVNI